MTESEFNDLVDTTLENIEYQLDDAESDLDYENSGGVLTVICENRSQIIFTRQAPVLQLWVATRSGGFHFDYKDGGWVRDSDGESLANFLQSAFRDQANEIFSFDFS